MIRALHNRINKPAFMLVSLEGVENSGKTKQMELLKEYYKDSAAYFHEPGTTTFGAQVRKVIMDNPHITPLAKVFSFSASRAELTKHITEDDDHELVILDRFFDSTTVYQGHGWGVNLDLLQTINIAATSYKSNADSEYKQRLIPHLTFVLDISLAEMKHRLSTKINANSYDTAFTDEFYEKVIKGYRELIERDSRFVLIDGTQSIDEIHTQIIEHIELYRELAALNPKWMHGYGY